LPPYTEEEEHGCPARRLGPLPSAAEKPPTSLSSTSAQNGGAGAFDSSTASPYTPPDAVPVGVAGGVPVEVGVPLREGVALLVGVGKDDAPALPVADAVGVRLPVRVIEGERLAVRDPVPLMLGVQVLVGEPLAVRDPVPLLLGVAAAEEPAELVPLVLRVRLGVAEGVGVVVAVGVMMELAVGLRVPVSGVTVGDREAVGDTEGDGVGVGDTVGEREGDMQLGAVSRNEKSLTVCCHAEPLVAPVKPKTALAPLKTADRLRGSERLTSAVPDVEDPSYHLWLVFKVSTPAPPSAQAA
jgi:hypothetical protein